MTNATKKSYIVNFTAIFLLWLLLFLLQQFGIVSNYFSGIIINTCIMIIMATSLNIVAGFLGEMALGHAGFMAIGAYTSAVISMAMKGMNLPGTLVLIISGICMDFLRPFSARWFPFLPCVLERRLSWYCHHRFCRNYPHLLD